MKSAAEVDSARHTRCAEWAAASWNLLKRMRPGAVRVSDRVPEDIRVIDHENVQVASGRIDRTRHPRCHPGTGARDDDRRLTGETIAGHPYPRIRPRGRARPSNGMPNCLSPAERQDVQITFSIGRARHVLGMAGITVPGCVGYRAQNVKEWIGPSPIALPGR